MIFVCPKCKEKLTISSSGAAICCNGHTYDRAKEGYYNLLLSNTRAGHGDNKEMVTARRTFLESGAYRPLAEKLCEVSLPYLFDGAVLLDAGCGEGYYTDYLAEHDSFSKYRLSFNAFDISKDAVRYAARKSDKLSLAVAGSYHMPISDGSVDILYNVFSPLALSETFRVVRKGGVFIMVIPAEEHLYGLKRILYETPYKNTVKNTELDGFTLVNSERVSYTLNLTDKNEIFSLFMMTPYAYRTPPAARERLMALDSLSTEAEFIVFTYRKPL